MPRNRMHCRPLRAWQSGALGVLALHLLMAAGLSMATEPADPRLPPLAVGHSHAVQGLSPAWQVPNPYRADLARRDQVLAAGAGAYARHCATCHGEGANQTVPEGPDLRRLNSVCNRLQDAALRPRCLQDVDSYFLESVLQGKRRAGQMHMPAWAGLIAPETVWAIRSYTESRPVPPPRLLPALPPVPTAAADKR